MKFSHKLGLLGLAIIMMTQTLLANETEHKKLTVDVNGAEQYGVDRGFVVLGDKDFSDISNSSTKKRFIPVELFTGAKWDGKHELILKEASTSASACDPVTGRRCTIYNVTGPFKTASNDTKIEWAGDKISYYRRTFSTSHMGKVESLFTINNSKDGLVRIYDKRKQWGARTYDGLGSKFPLGYWKQGEVRTYPSRRPTSIEIIELDGPDHCLTFRWVIGDGKKRNSDNNYTFCPERGFTYFSQNYESVDSKK
jgi:hypothetical protein